MSSTSVCVKYAEIEPCSNKCYINNIILPFGNSKSLWGTTMSFEHMECLRSSLGTSFFKKVVGSIIKPEILVLFW